MFVTSGSTRIHMTGSIAGDHVHVYGELVIPGSATWQRYRPFSADGTFGSDGTAEESIVGLSLPRHAGARHDHDQAAGHRHRCCAGCARRTGRCSAIQPVRAINACRDAEQAGDHDPDGRRTAARSGGAGADEQPTGDGPASVERARLLQVERGWRFRPRHPQGDQVLPARQRPGSHGLRDRHHSRVAGRQGRRARDPAGATAGSPATGGPAGRPAERGRRFHRSASVRVGADPPDAGRADSAGDPADHRRNAGDHDARRPRSRRPLRRRRRPPRRSSRAAPAQPPAPDFSTALASLQPIDKSFVAVKPAKVRDPAEGDGRPGGNPQCRRSHRRARPPAARGLVSGGARRQADRLCRDEPIGDTVDSRQHERHAGGSAGRAAAGQLKQHRLPGPTAGAGRPGDLAGTGGARLRPLLRRRHRQQQLQEAAEAQHGRRGRQGGGGDARAGLRLHRLAADRRQRGAGRRRPGRAAPQADAAGQSAHLLCRPRLVRRRGRARLLAAGRRRRRQPVALDLECRHHGRR